MALKMLSVFFLTLLAGNAAADWWSDVKDSLEGALEEALHGLNNYATATNWQEKTMTTLNETLGRWDDYPPGSDLKIRIEAAVKKSLHAVDTFDTGSEWRNRIIAAMNKELEGLDNVARDHQRTDSSWVKSVQDIIASMRSVGSNGSQHQQMNYF